MYPRNIIFNIIIIELKFAKSETTGYHKGLSWIRTWKQGTVIYILTSLVQLPGDTAEHTSPSGWLSSPTPTLPKVIRPANGRFKSKSARMYNGVILTLYFISYIHRGDIFWTKNQNIYLNTEFFRDIWVCDVVLKFSLGNKILA